MMRRGNSLRESTTDNAADWEPLVLASVGPCRGGREGWSHAELTQNSTQWANFSPASLLNPTQIFSLCYQEPLASIWYHKPRCSVIRSLQWNRDQATNVAVSEQSMYGTQRFDGFVLKAACFDEDPHEATGS